MTRVLVVVPGEDKARVEEVGHDLATFNRLVGGPIEGLTLGEGVSVYINEEAKYLHLPVNERADLIVRSLLARVGRHLLPGDVINGPAVFLGHADSDGWDTDVPQWLVDAVVDHSLADLLLDTDEEDGE